MTADPGGRVLVDLEDLCATELTHVELQERSVQLLRRAVPFDVAIQATMDPATMIETSCLPIGIPRDAERERRFLELEYTAGDPLPYVEVAARPERATALASEVEDLATVRRYAELLGAFGVSDELRAAFVVDGCCWGTLTLYRTGSSRFERRELEVFTAATKTVARGLRRAFLRAAADTADGAHDQPGHCIVDRRGELLTTTAAAERWLDTLGGDDRLPAAVAAIVARVGDHPDVSATVVGSDGPLTLHATAAKGTDDAVALIIERPRPVRLAPLVMAAHGLTEREREVTEAVLQGLATRQIARRLEIADSTVQDHLKAIFAKVGVATRGELAYALCLRHYLPLVHEGATPGPYGYFLGR